MAAKAGDLRGSYVVTSYTYPWRTRAKEPLLRSRGFCEKLGFLGSEFLDYLRAELEKETKNGQIDCFPCYDKR
jgi:hypothetical protein